MTVKPSYSAILGKPGDDFYDRLGGWISGSCWWTDSGPAGVLAALQADSRSSRSGRRPPWTGSATYRSASTWTCTRTRS
jgi:hypothetical protein